MFHHANMFVLFVYRGDDLGDLKETTLPPLYRLVPGIGDLSGR